MNFLSPLFPLFLPLPIPLLLIELLGRFRFYREITVTRLLECFLRECIDRVVQKEKKRKKEKTDNFYMGSNYAHRAVTSKKGGRLLNED